MNFLCVLRRPCLRVKIANARTRLARAEEEDDRERKTTGERGFASRRVREDSDSLFDQRHAQSGSPAWQVHAGFGFVGPPVCPPALPPPARTAEMFACVLRCCSCAAASFAFA